MGRWIRLNVDFDNSEWLFVLSAESQLAWIKLLCHMKRDGARGRCKAMSVAVAAKRWGLGPEHVEKLLQAAQNDGALRVADGEWAVTAWGKYQEEDATNAERQKRFRERKQEPTVTESNALLPLCNTSHCHATETETYNPPIVPPGGTGEPPKKTRKSPPDHSIGVSIPEELQAINGFEEAWKLRCTQRFAEPKKRFSAPATVEAELKILLRCRDPLSVLERATASCWQGLNAKPEDFGERRPPPAQPAQLVELDGTGKFVEVPTGSTAEQIQRLKQGALERLGAPS